MCEIQIARTNPPTPQTFLKLSPQVRGTVRTLQDAPGLVILCEAVKLGQAETETRLRIAAAHNKPLATLIRPVIQTTGHCYEDIKRLIEKGKYESSVRVLIRVPKDR